MDRILIAGHRGMVGSALMRRLQGGGSAEIMGAGRDDADFREQAAVRGLLRKTHPDAVVIAAARVGGIEANRSRPAEFIYDNLMIAANFIHESFQAAVDRVLFLGSSCIYPRMAAQPMAESALLSGPLEPTNEGYAVAKIAGLKLCQHYRSQYGVTYSSLMPTNLYGPGDNYDPVNSHVLPALIRRFHEARQRGDEEVVVWGTGRPRREFLHVDDLAAAIEFVLPRSDAPDWLNVGSGEEVSIAHLAKVVAEAVGYSGRLRFDTSKPDGPPRKLVDGSVLRGMGWEAKIPLHLGVEQTVRSFQQERAEGTLRGT